MDHSARGHSQQQTSLAFGSGAWLWIPAYQLHEDMPAPQRLPGRTGYLENVPRVHVPGVRLRQQRNVEIF